MSDSNPRPDIPDVEWYSDGAVAPRVLNAEEQQQVRTYLAKKFGLDLPETQDSRENEG